MVSPVSAGSLSGVSALVTTRAGRVETSIEGTVNCVGWRYLKPVPESAVAFGYRIVVPGNTALNSRTIVPPQVAPEEIHAALTFLSLLGHFKNIQEFHRALLFSLQAIQRYPD